MKRLSVLLVFVFLVTLCFNLSVGQAQKLSAQIPEPCEPLVLPDCPPPNPPPPPPVAALVFETVNSPLTDNPTSMGGGKRIFPDRNTPGDTTNRKIIRVKATLSHAPAPNIGYKILFKAFDVDDPSTDTIIDPNNNSGNDNRPVITNGNAGTLSESETSAGNSSELAMTIPNDATEMIAYLTVTMQPGNNVVVAASTKEGFSEVSVDGTGLKDGSGNSLPTADIKRTELLTTWRRLHIEVDSMGTVSGNKVEGNIVDEILIRRNQTATLNITTAAALETNRFENGRLVVAGGSLKVTCDYSQYIDCNTANTITVKNTGISTVYISANDAFTLYDDDDFNNDGLLDGDFLDDIPMPDTSRLSQNSDDATANVFAPAYIHPVYDIGNSNDDVDVVINFASGSASYIRSNIYMFGGRPTQASSQFWTIYLIGVYQATTNIDGDPNSQGAALGTVDDNYPSGEGASIFMESNRAEENPLNWMIYPRSQSYTVAHEVGHLFGGSHLDEGLMTQAGDRVDGSFSSKTLNKIRMANFP